MDTKSARPQTGLRGFKDVPDPEDEFDAEAFFGIAEDNLDKKDLGIDDDLMMKAIEIMTA